jgi:hypothetical protein
MLDHPYDPETWLPYILLVVEFSKAIAWPAILALAIWFLRQPILSILQRVVSVKAGSVEFGLETVREAQLSKSNFGSLEEPSVVQNLPRTPAIQDQERAIREMLKLYPANEHEEILINAVAIEKLEKHFALVYANIFGSQIRALRELNQTGGVVDRKTAQEEFSALQSEQPALNEWNLERYAMYLINNGLVESTERGFEITSMGREFVVFLTKYGLAENKPL